MFVASGFSGVWPDGRSAHAANESHLGVPLPKGSSQAAGETDRWLASSPYDRVVEHFRAWARNQPRVEAFPLVEAAGAQAWHLRTDDPSSPWRGIHVARVGREVFIVFLRP